ncbi:MerR family transcriptional regulator [Leucobacter sp. L43]|uniref:MerR family transcriptional regulator n=1 Tax=Leucobacter sp. L43 TaxID=2798040 RepID=UPI0019068313|nr:MerR family transcriptional regulator [Leucobacter sp. L43]
MRISELSARTGVTVPTIKFYLREGLLPEGERSAPTQSSYGEKHVDRLGVIRALLDSGVSVAETRRVVTVLDAAPARPEAVLGQAHAAVTPPGDEQLDLAEAERLVEGLGWVPGACDAAVLRAVAQALRGLEKVGFAVPDAVMAEYLVSMRRIADTEIAHVPTESADAAVRYVVLGSVLVEPLLLALRRVAQQVSSGERFASES